MTPAYLDHATPLSGNRPQTVMMQKKRNDPSPQISARSRWAGCQVINTCANNYLGLGGTTPT